MPVMSINTKSCIKGKTALKAFPLERKDLAGKMTTKKPWTVLVCTGCHANEVLPIVFEVESEINPKFPAKMWERLHGYTRTHRYADTRGQLHDETEPVAAKWMEGDCLSTTDAKHLVETDTGKIVTEAFTTVDYDEIIKQRDS